MTDAATKRPLYSLSTVGRGDLWESDDPRPVMPPDMGNVILGELLPVYFSVAAPLGALGITPEQIRNRAMDVINDGRGKTAIGSHPTVLEEIGIANRDTDLWHIPQEDMDMWELQSLYRVQILEMAQRRTTERVVPVREGHLGQWSINATRVKPEGSRIDLHSDNRRTAIVNLSEAQYTGRTLFGHPSLRIKYGGRIPIQALREDPRTVIQTLAPGCGAAFDARFIPHVGESNPGTSGWRFIMDANFDTVSYRRPDVGVDPILYQEAYPTNPT